MDHPDLIKRADQRPDSYRSVHTDSSSGSSAMWIIVGGIVVVLAVIGFFLAGGDGGTGSEAGGAPAAIEGSADPVPADGAAGEPVLAPEAQPVAPEAAPDAGAAPATEEAPAGN